MDDHSYPDPHPRIALVWRGEPDDSPSPKTERFEPLIAALKDAGARPFVVPFSEIRLDEIRSGLSDADGVLTWVDPLDPRGDRRTLDALLRELAARGVWLGADPDVILKMGAKSVLYATKALSWGVDTRLYRSRAEMETGLREGLAAGPRVVKRNRGNGGQGVWKVEAERGDRVRVLEAARGSDPCVETLSEFCAAWATEFATWGFVIDQPYQPRLPDGMIRTYVCQDLVVGFGVQRITALLWPPSEPGPRIMQPADHPPLQALRQQMEDDWIPGLRKRLDIRPGSLPALWDADFLYGPKTAFGEDSYVLCEINASSVAPFPPSAVTPLVQAAIAGAVGRTLAAKR
jgi:hypothetical protein